MMNTEMIGNAANNGTYIYYMEISTTVDKTFHRKGKLALSKYISVPWVCSARWLWQPRPRIQMLEFARSP